MTTMKLECDNKTAKLIQKLSKAKDPTNPSVCSQQMSLAFTIYKEVERAICTISFKKKTKK